MNYLLWESRSTKIKHWLSCFKMSSVYSQKFAHVPLLSGATFGQKEFYLSYLNASSFQGVLRFLEQQNFSLQEIGGIAYSTHLIGKFSFYVFRLQYRLSIFGDTSGIASSRGFLLPVFLSICPCAVWLRHKVGLWNFLIYSVAKTGSVQCT